MTEAKVRISEKSLRDRINRALPDGELLRKARPRSRAEADHGTFFLVDLACGAVKAQHVDIEALGRKLGVLRAYETLE
jgi:hypothetical protein